jgi:hypothetical protein
MAMTHLHAWAPCPICHDVFRLAPKDGESYSIEPLANHMVARHAEHPTMTALGVPYIPAPVPVRLPVTVAALDRALVGVEPISDDDDVEAVDELLHRLAHTLVPDDDDGSGVAAVVAAIELLLGAPRYWSKPSFWDLPGRTTRLPGGLKVTTIIIRKDA